MAAALTYTTLLALVPALVLMLGIFGTVSYFSRYAQSFRSFAFANLVPDAAGRVTAIYVEQFVQGSHRRGKTKKDKHDYYALGCQAGHRITTALEGGFNRSRWAG